VYLRSRDLLPGAEVCRAFDTVQIKYKIGQFLKEILDEGFIGKAQAGFRSELGVLSGRFVIA
jgi:hypothetical protein